MNRLFHGLVLVLCTAALSTGCCKKGEEDKIEPVTGASDPAPSGPSITGDEALAKLKAAGYTPLTDPVVGENGGIKSTAAVLKPDMITVNIIEYSDEGMAKMASSASPSSDAVLSHLAGKSVIRVTCAGKPKDKCEKIMSAMTE